MSSSNANSRSRTVGGMFVDVLLERRVSEPRRLTNPSRTGDGDARRLPSVAFFCFARASRATASAFVRPPELAKSASSSSDNWVS